MHICAGFLNCEPYSNLSRAYGKRTARVTYQDFIDHAEEWAMGQNPQVRFIAQAHGLKEEHAENMFNNTKFGEDHLRHAKEHLDRMDFVIIQDHFMEQFVAFFGVPPPHTNPNPFYPGVMENLKRHGYTPGEPVTSNDAEMDKTMKATSFSKNAAITKSTQNKTMTPAESEAILRINTLDYRLYKYGIELSDRLVRRGPLQSFSSLGKLPSEVMNQVVAKHSRNATERNNGNNAQVTVSTEQARSMRCLSFHREQASRAFRLHPGPGGTPSEAGVVLDGAANSTDPAP